MAAAVYSLRGTPGAPMWRRSQVFFQRRFAGGEGNRGVRDRQTFVCAGSAATPHGSASPGGAAGGL